MSIPEPERRAKGAFHVPPFLHLVGGLVHRHPRVGRWLGRRESAALADDLRRVAVRRPIYVCGLARSGSTLLHEVVASHPGVATHRGKDYPMLFTPYWWRRATASSRPQAPRERPHHDGVMVTPDSPDSLEEMLWMAFFPRCHDPAVSHLMTDAETHPDFESFYDNHLRKLLLAEGATRYAAKANYHIARLRYLLRLYPDARILLPVRSPSRHVASLLHQHRWFSDGQRSHPRLLAYMRRTGHFEFGLDRRPMHLGDGERVRLVADAWSAGDEVRGLALYWDMVYRYLADLIDSNDGVRAAVQVVRYEDIRAAPAETLRAALEHCDLPDAAAVARQAALKVRSATTSDRSLSPADMAIIQRETAATASRWGY